MKSFSIIKALLQPQIQKEYICYIKVVKYLNLCKNHKSFSLSADKAPVQMRSSAQPGANVALAGAGVIAPVLAGSTFTGPVSFNYSSHAAGNGTLSLL